MRWDAKSLFLIKPLDVIRTGVSFSLKLKLIHQSRWGHIRTTSSIHNKRTHSALDGAPSMKDVLSLFFMGWTFDTTKGPSKHKKFPFIGFFHIFFLLTIIKTGCLFIFFLLFYFGLFKLLEFPSVGTFRCDMPEPLTLITPPPLKGVSGWFGYVWFGQRGGRGLTLWFGHRDRWTPLGKSRVGSLRGFWGSLLYLAFFWSSTLWASELTSSRVEYGWSSTTFCMDSLSPPK